MFTRRLIHLRHSSSALSQGSYRAVDGIPADCFAYLRESDGQLFLIVLNFSEQEQFVNLPALGSGQILLSTYLDREEGVDLAALSLRGAEGCVITLENR
jgi:hypothetical protein